MEDQILPHLNLCQDTLGQYLLKECEHDTTGPSLIWKEGTELIKLTDFLEEVCDYFFPYLDLN